MEIWLLRSAAMEDILGDGVPPEHRYLSVEGRRSIRAIGTLVKTNEAPAFNAVFASPHASAVQTAELFADRVDYLGAVQVLPSLATHTPASVIMTPLLTAGDAIVIVADEPRLSSLGAFLVSSPSFPQFMHAQVSVLRDRQPAWRLRPGDLARHQLLLV